MNQDNGPVQVLNKVLNSIIPFCKLVKVVLNLQNNIQCPFLRIAADELRFPGIMKLSHIIILLLSGLLLLSGCRSSKGGGKNAYKGNAAGMTNYAVDYSNEEYDAMGDDLASEARKWLGTPYRYGGRDRNGTDCSGLVMELYRTVCSMKIPRTTVEQKSYCTKVARNKARAGDLVFFGSGKGTGSVSHVGLYIGKGEMIHASSSRGVMVSKVDAGYWGERFRSVGRIDGAYTAWANTGRGVKSDKKKGARPAGGDDLYPVPETPSEIPSPVSPVPVPVAEIAYNQLPASAASASAATPGAASAAAPVVDGRLPVSGELAMAVDAQKKADAASPARREAADKTDPVASIDLLDLIINQKADSIFSESFMD